MTSRAMTTSSGVSVSTRRPLVHQRQISFLALPPLLIPATSPTPPGNPSSQNYAHSTLSTTAYPPLEPTPPVPSYTPPPTTSILRPPSRPTGSLIAHLQQHQLQQQQQKRLLTTQNEMSEQIPEIITRTRAAASGIPGEQVEPRQTLPTEDMEPNPANSIPLPPNRQKLVEDIIALYSCQITVDRVARYAPGKSTPVMGGRWLIVSLCLRRPVRLRQWYVFFFANRVELIPRSIQDGRSVVWVAQAFPQVRESRLRGRQERRYPHPVQEQAGTTL